MKKFLYPDKDSTIYSRIPTLNSGLDEILYVGKESGSGIIRSLLHFDISNISQSIVSGLIPTSSKFFLNLKMSNSKELQANQLIYLYPVSQSWTEGTGYLAQDIENPSDGNTWIHRTGITENLLWENSGSSYVTNSYSGSYEFTGSNDDVRIDVTDIVGSWLSGSIQNNGFLLKLSSSLEENYNNLTNIAFFSRNTHTIYKPTLEIAWNDQTFSTGTLSAAPTDGLLVSTKNVRNTYYKNTSAKIDIIARKKYPLKTFDTIFRYNITNYLPTSSYYSIIDVATNETIIPFDDYSKISCNTTGSYFMMDTSPLYKNRKYAILVKIDYTSFQDVFNTDTIFEIK